MSGLSKIATPFQIGSLTLPNRLIQAPLAGISCAPFRGLFSLYSDGQPAYAVTEMIPALSLLQKSSTNINKRYLAKSEHEARWCIQLSGHDPDSLHRAALQAAQHSPDIIDLNCGCPKPKVRRKGDGSALAESLVKLRACVAALRAANPLPLSVKIRVAGSTETCSDREKGSSDLHNYLEAASVIEDCGADVLVVHGRHHSDGYDVPASYAQIRRVVERVTIPVVANGDVCDAASLQRCVEETGAAAVMVGRGSIGRPWIFQQLLAACRSADNSQNTPLTISQPEPSADGVLRAFRTHVEGLAALEGEAAALLQARRLLKWYFPLLSPVQVTACHCCRDIRSLCALLADVTSCPMLVSV
jgi:tRNA-dihydrouridine synthase B